MMKANIVLDSDFHVGQVDRRIFGGFLEHLGRAVYEGVYDPESPLSDENGFRKDVIAALKRLDMPVMRYPGGNFVSCYDWRDGVGPRGQRPTRPDYAWRTLETNQFGTDEFMQWCKLLGTEPMMAVNLGTRGIEDAAHLLEYCNLETPTYWAEQRKRNGHPKGYGVKYWCLGNEMDGPWQAGYMPAQDYAIRASGASRMIKGLDRSTQTIVCGSSARSMPTYMSWDREVLEYCWDTVDFISAHRYSNNNAKDTDHFLAEGVEIDRVLQDYQGCIDYVRGLKRTDKTVYLSFDEWNVWYRAHGASDDFITAPKLLEEVYNFEDALVAAQYLHSFIRYAGLVKMACIAQIANVIAPIMTKRDGLLFQTIFYPFEQLSKNAHGKSLRVNLNCPTYKAGARGEVPTIDAVAVYNDDGKTMISIINRSQADSATVTVELNDRTITNLIEATELTGFDVKAANTWEAPNAVTLKPGNVVIQDGKAIITAGAPSHVVVTLGTKGK